MRRVNVGDLVGFSGHQFARMGHVFSRSSGPTHGNLVIEAISPDTGRRNGSAVRHETEVTELAMSFAGPEQVIR